MGYRNTDSLFLLIHSLEKNEKRNFKLFMKGNSTGDSPKVIQLFDALDKMTVYNEEQLLSKNKSITKVQLSNLKAYLFKQILASLRSSKYENNIQLQLHELMDHARILYNKGLYLQSLKVLERMKELSKVYNQVSYMQQIIHFEKKIENLYITRSMHNRAEMLAIESEQITQQNVMIDKLSSLSLLLYSWYIEHGHARNLKDEEKLQEFWKQHLPENASTAKGFYERLYLYQSHCWHAFIRQDFLQYYRYTQKWVNLFEEQPAMIAAETGNYIKGMHNLLGAHFDLMNQRGLSEALVKFEQFADSTIANQNDNNRIQTFVYLYTSKINKHFIEGTFTEGLSLVPYIEEKLKEYEIYLDRHRVLVFYYKIACLYFGTGDNEQAIEYLNKIINWKVDLRSDLQCYARLLHLIAHYELGNFDLLEYLIKSVYRFMAKMGNLSAVEEEMFKFLRKSFALTKKDIKPALEKLLNKLKQYERKRFETRAFAYLDVISWLESKLNNVPVQDIIRKKYQDKIAT